MLGLEQVIGRYGGAARWERLSAVTLRLRQLGGPLPWLKGRGHTFPLPGVVRVSPRQLRTEFLDYPEPGSTTVFEQGQVTLLGRGGASSPFGSEQPRATFAGLRKYRRWRAQDAAYFFGYALTTYFGVPFLLGTLPTQVRPWGAGGLRVRAEFPASFHTHSPRQEFFFGPDGLLLRHDYTAEIVGRWATGAHFTSDYVEVEGLPIPRQRRVYARLGGAVTPLPVLHATLEPLEVR